MNKGTVKITAYSWYTALLLNFTGNIGNMDTLTAVWQFHISWLQVHGNSSAYFHYAALGTNSELVKQIASFVVHILVGKASHHHKNFLYDCHLLKLEHSLNIYGASFLHNSHEQSVFFVSFVYGIIIM